MIHRAGKISMLLPLDSQKQKIKFYEDFILQYSLIISSNLIIYNLVEESNEEHLFELFTSYHTMFNEYIEINKILPILHLELQTPQQNEIRGLILDRFFIEMFNKKYSSKDLLKHFINFKEFVVLYSLFEGILKEEFIRCRLIDENKFLKEKDIIEYILKKYENISKIDLFEKILKDRSIYNIGLLKLFWDLYTHFRHLFFHNAGKITSKWKNKFDNIKDKLIDILDKSNSNSILNLNIIEDIEYINSFIKINEYFFVSDKFSNMFRDFIINILEAMYLTDLK